MPTGYVDKVRTQYKKLYGKDISARTVKRFLSGDTYTSETNKAVLVVVQEQDDLVEATKKALEVNA